MTPIRPESPGALPVTLIQALLPTAGLGDHQAETALWINQLNLGQRVIAEVQAHLSDGSFLVKIGDTTSRMNLPAATIVGEKINLTLISKAPLPTFILNANSAAATTDSSVMSLSNTGKLITALLQHTANEIIPLSLLGKTPIVSQANLPVPELAHALQQAITTSGLFYESHLNEWIAGQRTIAELMQEPQAAQTNQIVALSSNPNIPVTAVITPSMATTATIAATVAATAASDTSITNPVLGQLVNQQLQTLEQNRIIWQGELWPGQPMQWEVSEDTPKRNETQIATSWSSKVRFELPQLGVIIAHLRLNGEQLSMQIHADTTAAAEQLQAHGSQLSSALAAAGIPLAALQVETNA
ncbi:MAG: flagellar hook-length control protein FliK [Sulfuriferula sp.]